MQTFPARSQGYPPLISYLGIENSLGNIFSDKIAPPNNKHVIRWLTRAEPNSVYPFSSMCLWQSPASFQILICLRRWTQGVQPAWKISVISVTGHL